MAERRRPLADRLAALAEAVELSRGRASDEIVDAAAAVTRRASERLAISGDHTVIALGGATGSGKSSLFNALSGTQLASSGVTRPTTSEAMAVTWGTELPARLLDWLDVRRRHLIAAPDSAWTRLVRLDLPDHDSTEAAHRMTVDRLVELVDMLVWVVDPQKYADAALHDGYLKPLAGHAEVMAIALNQVDRLTLEQRDGALSDLRRLIDSEGLGRSPLLGVSALTGEGLAELKALIANAAQAKAMAVRRLEADVTREASRLGAELGGGRLPEVTSAQVAELNNATAVAAGVPQVVESVRDAWRHRGMIATGWPMVAWIRRLKPDPLRRLRMGLAPAELSPTQVSRTSLPKANAVQRARLDAALRQVIDSSTAGLPRGWADQVRAAARGDVRVLADRLDAALAATPLRMDSGHGWWPVVTVLQWLLFVSAVAGGLWLAAPWALAMAQVPLDVPMPAWEGWPIPTLLLTGGVGGGVLLHLVSRLLVEGGAQARARTARRMLTESVAGVTEAEVVGPVRAELARLSDARGAVERAR